MAILAAQHPYLVGIKGVAMTALAQCLVDAGLTVRGCDSADTFVTQPLLDNLGIQVDTGFEHLPPDADLVIYTAAHQASQNQVVRQAEAKNLPTLTHAEALAELFNSKRGVAVCGVGGKSTTSAMLAWITDRFQPASFAVGVGNIPGLEKTGQWIANADWMIVEADEYATDPVLVSQGQPLIPRFQYLHPEVIVCQNIRFDHPDVYQDFAQTLQTFQRFFDQIHGSKILIINSDDQPLVQAAQASADHTQATVISIGERLGSSWQLQDFQAAEGVTTSSWQTPTGEITIKLQVPGLYNARNAAAAVAAAVHLGIAPDEAVLALADFRSTQRRAEFKGERQGVRYYDDYAHHPLEITEVIKAFKAWFPERTLAVAFQPHTYSRTEALLPEFVHSLELADQVAIMDIFASAREQVGQVSSQDLVKALEASGAVSAVATPGIPDLVKWCNQLSAGTVCLTLGAGDIYTVYDQLQL